jgi:hypothetical protein
MVIETCEETMNALGRCEGVYHQDLRSGSSQDGR